MSRARRSIHRFLSGFRVPEGFEWLLMGIPLFFLIILAVYTPFGVDVLRAQFLGGTAGTVAVSDCEYRGGRYNDWDCTGTFTSDDGRLRIPDIKIQVKQPQEARPVSPVPARVSGPSADTARQPELAGALVRLVPFPLLVVVAIYSWRMVLSDDDEPDRKRQA